jgi:hypothetical protein
MMILYIVLGAFTVGLGVITAANMLTQKPGRRVLY